MFLKSTKQTKNNQVKKKEKSTRKFLLIRMKTLFIVMALFAVVCTAASLNLGNITCSGGSCPPLQAGLPISPVCYIGTQLLHDTSVLGQLAPGLANIEK